MRDLAAVLLTLFFFLVQHEDFLEVELSPNFSLGAAFTTIATTTTHPPPPQSLIMTVTDELKKYSLVALVVVIAYQVIGIILAVLSGSAYVKGPALLAFFLNVVAASLVLCGKAAGKHTALAVLFGISAVMYVVEVLLTAILVLPRVGIFMSMAAAAIRRRRARRRKGRVPRRRRH